MRVLLIGANGMLGKDLVQEWTDDELIPATSRDADIRNPQEVEGLIARTRPEWILLTAAYTDVDGSEREPDAAYAVNQKGTENVAKSARKYGESTIGRTSSGRCTTARRATTGGRLPARARGAKVHSRDNRTCAGGSSDSSRHAGAREPNVYLND